MENQNQQKEPEAFILPTDLLKDIVSRIGGNKELNLSYFEVDSIVRPLMNLKPLETQGADMVEPSPDPQNESMVEPDLLPEEPDRLSQGYQFKPNGNHPATATRS